MNKWVMITVAGILVVVTVTNGVLYFQQSGKLKDTEDQLAALETDFSGLEGDLSSLEGGVSALEEDVSALEAHDRAIMDVVAMLEPSVVMFEVYTGGGMYQGGSGVIFTNTGWVMTNRHVERALNQLK